MISKILANINLNKNLISPFKIIDRAKLNLSYILKSKKSMGFPTFFVVELTNSCNLNCIMCPRNRQKRKVGFMSFELFKKILSQIKNKAELIDLDFYGEILLHPEYEKFIRYAKSLGLKLAISTNCTLLNEKNALKLIDSGVDQITLSLDASSKKTYEKIRKGANYEKSMRNLERFLQLNNNKVFTTIQLIYMKENKKEILDFISQWKNKRINMVRIKPYLDLDPTKKNLRVNNTKKNFIKPCILLWKWMVITWEGMVLPCCNDYDNIHVLGDAKTESLKKIWNSKRMRMMRETHLNGNAKKIPLCRGCEGIEASNFMVMSSTFIDELNRRRILPIIEKEAIINKKDSLKYA